MSMIDTMLERLSGVAPADRAADSNVPPRPVVVGPPAPRIPHPVKVPRREYPADRRTFQYDRSERLISFTPHDHWTIEDAFSGLHVLGGNGSGKSSGSGSTIAKAFLRAGFGGLVLCAKNDEVDAWRRYAKECGRSKHLIIVTEQSDWRFNLISYEMGRSGDAAGRVDNLVTTLMNLVEQTGRRGQGDDHFWSVAAEQLLRNTLMVLAASQEQFSLLDVQRFIDAIPRDPKAAETDGWKSSDMAMKLANAEKAYTAVGRPADYDAIYHYLTVQFAGLGDRTRSSVTFTLSAMLQDLLVGSSRELFATGTNFCPEDTHNGAVIVLDLPAALKRSHATAQTLFKVVWQMAALRRMKDISEKTRPVFLWADESHFFVSDMDIRFQSLARAARVATVFMTQNISAYRAKLGSQSGGDLTNTLLGLFQTTAFHAQSDPATIEFAQKLFGKRPVTRVNDSGSRTRGTSDSTSRGWSSTLGYTISHGGPSSYSGGGGVNESETAGTNWSATDGYSTSTTMENVLEAADFSSLATGSDQAPRQMRGIAQAYVFRLGRVWSNGSTALLAHFDRRAS
jgi:hypothetical protein